MKKLKNQRKLEKHLTSRTEVKKYSCDRCHITFDAIAFQSVKNKHAQICSGKPSENESLNKDSESTLPPRYCYLCDYVTPSQNKVRKDQVLKKHFETCHGGQKFICTDCGVCFPIKQSLIEHMDSIHGEKEQITFAWKEDLKTYVKVPRVRKKPYECLECPASFMTRQNLEKHLQLFLKLHKE